jgi:hypothetical protein
MKTIVLLLLLLIPSTALAQNCNPYYRQQGYGYNATTITVPPTNWTTELAKAVALRDDKRSFLQALDALGFRYSGGGYQSTGDQYGSSYSQHTAQQGNSVYGYNETASLYSNVDLGALYAAAERLTSNAQEYGANAIQGHQGLVGQAADVQARLLEIREKAQAMQATIAAAGQASKPGDTATITRNFVGQQPGGPPQPQNQFGGVGPLAVDQLPPSVQKCAVCHLKEMKMPIGAMMNPEQRLDSIGRLMLPADHKDHMPKGGELSPEELSETVAYFSGRR